MNGNGELTETENVIFLRKLWSSYGILTDERNPYVLCYESGYGNGYLTVETRHQSTTSSTLRRRVPGRLLLRLHALYS